MEASEGLRRFLGQGDHRRFRGECRGERGKLNDHDAGARGDLTGLNCRSIAERSGSTENAVVGAIYSVLLRQCEAVVVERIGATVVHRTGVIVVEEVPNELFEGDLFVGRFRCSLGPSG